MPRLVKGPDGVTHSFPDDATDDEVRSALGGDKPTGVVAPGSSFGEKVGNAAKMIGSTALGFGKAAANTALTLGEAAGHIPNLMNPLAPNLRESVDELYAKPGLSKSAMGAAREETAYQNTPERVGGALETLAEMAIPVTKGIKAIPSAARAGAKFQEVMGAAKNIPIVTDAAGDVGLRIMQLAERGGGSLPRPVSQFLQRITHPDKAPMVYEEARDFASGISRLSANEMQRLSPTVAREVAELRVTLNRAVADAAGKAGKAKEYAQAMNEYAKAKRLSGMIEDVVTGAKKAIPYGIGAGAVGAGAAAGYWLTKEMKSLLGGD